MQIFNFLKIKKDEFLFKNKNRQNRKNIYIVVGFIFGALMLSLIIVQLFGYNFGDAFTHLFSQSFNRFLYKDLLFNFSVLGLAALAFAFSYKSGLFNIGISGQMMGAGLGIIAFAKLLQPDITKPSILGDYGVIYTILIAILVGILIAGFTGLLKILFNVHEVVSSILINWIVFFLTKYLISDGGPLHNPSKVTHSYEISNEFAIYDPNQNSGFIAAICIFIACALIVWILLKFTSFGKKIKSVGLSKNASFYSGYNTKLLQLSSFIISGTIAGLLAVVVYTGTAEKAIPIPLVDSLPTYGFDGIAIGLIAFSNPIAIIPVAFFMGIIQTSSNAAAPFPETLSNMMLGIIMYGTAIFVIFYKFKLITKLKLFLKKRSKKYKDSYYVNNYDIDKNKRIQDIEDLLSKRKMNIFSEYINLRKEKSISFFNFKAKTDLFKEKLKLINLNNNIYFDSKSKLREKTSIIKSLKTNNSFYEEEAIDSKILSEEK